MAKLYFKYGAMGSSKTANAIMVQYNYRERGQKALMVKPALENRDGSRVVASRVPPWRTGTGAGLWLPGSA